MPKNLRILLIVDPKVTTESLRPRTLFNWSTVYAYSLIQAFNRLGNEVEIENIYEIIKGESPRLGGKKFNHALVVVNNASKDFGAKLFDNIRNLLLPGGLIGLMSDHDHGIEFEDVRFCATVIYPEEQDPRVHQVYWGCDPDFLIPEKDESCLTILLDSWWHLEEKKYDRTPEILEACLEYAESSEKYIRGREEIKILAWGNNGIEEFQSGENDKLVRRPIRIGFEELMRNLRRADVFMVTHSESMGLTILEAAMAGCVVVIPVPANPNPDVSRWIRSDLSETIPHVEFSHRAEEKIEIPWDEISDRMDSSNIRGETIEFTWERVAERIIEGWEVRAEFHHRGEDTIQEEKRERSLNKINTDSKLRELMLISVDMAAWPENEEIREEYCRKWGLDKQDF
jgi:glycosyltransferase involved in cell wall biosynthesis